MITMADIARRAGVSRSTASFVLGNGEMAARISPGTRQRVLDAARELGYRRNELARAVVTGKNFVLGYLQAAACEQESRILEGVLREAAASGYLVKVISHGGLGSYHEVSRLCAEQRLAGMIIRRFNPAEVVGLSDELTAYGIPFVFVDDNLDLPGACSITSDDDQGVQLAVEHLIGLGHREIAFVAGDPAYPQTLLRADSFLRTLARHGIAARSDAVLESDWGFQQIEVLTRQVFSDSVRRPTALFCNGDTLAAIAIRELRRLGVRVPEDVSVVGYGGFVFAELIDPPLTTIAQPFEEIGRVSVQSLLRRVDADRSREESPDATDGAGRIRAALLPTELVIRGSTAPRPAALG